MVAMPNQLVSTKRRQSLAEHAAVLAALAEIARREGKTVVALLRQAVRDTVKARADDPARVKWLRAAVMPFCPEPPDRFATAAQLARFKRAQREFDDVLLALQLTSPDAVQSRNSIIAPHCKIRILELERSHAKRSVA
jgi:hypothetical protein